jgi:hypothetical protein
MFIKDKDLIDYYLSASKSVCEGLGIKNYETAHLIFSDPSKLGHSILQSHLEHYLRIRALTIWFQDEGGNTIEGDLWGTGDHLEEEAPLKEKARPARHWYIKAADELLLGIPHLDEVICKILGWPTDRTITYAELREKFHYPTPPEFNP